MLNSWHIEFAHGIITRYILTQGYMRKSTGERIVPWSKYTRVPFFAPVYYWLHHTLTNEHVVNLNTRENSTVETRIPVKLMGIYWESMNISWHNKYMSFYNSCCISSTCYSVLYSLDDRCKHMHPTFTRSNFTKPIQFHFNL